MSEKIDELYSRYGVTITETSGAQFSCPVGEVVAINWTVHRKPIPIFTMGMKEPQSFARGKRGIEGEITFKNRPTYGGGFNLKITYDGGYRMLYGIQLSDQPTLGSVYTFTARDIGPTMIDKPEEVIPVPPEYDDEDYINGIDMLSIGSEGVSPYDLSIEIEQTLDPHTIDIAGMIFGWIEEGLLEFRDGKIYRV